MDLFKFTNPTAPTRMEGGKFLKDTISKMWVERYREAGEFEIKSYVSSGLRKELPLGTFVSHTDTKEIMIVDDHKIETSDDEEDTLIVTGRSFESYLENRVVGSNITFPHVGDSETMDVSLGPEFSGQQARTLILNHTITSRLIDDNNAIPYFEVLCLASGEDSLERVLKRGDLYSAVKQILEEDNLGIKSVRPYPGSPATNDINTVLIIHSGEDKSKTVIFSYDSGEIEKADYLWSVRKLKNTAMVSGRWVETLVTTPLTGYARRMMFVDASDIDGKYNELPTGDRVTRLVALMQKRGKQALAAQKEIALIGVNASKTASKYVYRKDYNIGDIITVDGEYNEQAKMRVSEYVEIEDQQGTVAYPTLTLP